MYLSLVFWLGLALPGYVAVRRTSPRDVESGLLGMLGLSYLATLGILSPISILCYCFRAPLWVLSLSCVVLIAAAIVEVTRRRWWGDVGKLLVGGACVELAVLISDMILGGRVGSLIGGDAVVHLARIRALLDGGFSNQNPFVAVETFFPIYHTNILHALYAACTHVTGVDHLGVWYAGIVWGKVLVASGAFYLAWCVFERRWVAWVAVVFVIAQQGPVTFIVYPNKIAPLWLLPYAMGFTIQACRGPCTWQSCIKIGISSLVLGQVHGMYAVFSVFVLGPCLLVATAIRFIRRQSDRTPMLICLLTLGIGLTFPLVSKWNTPSNHSPGRPTHAAARSDLPTPTQDPLYTYFENGWLMKQPLRGFGGNGGIRFIALAMGIACACVGARRKEAALLAAMLATVAAILYIPPLCTAIVDTLGRTWMLSRLEVVLPVGFVVLVPCAVAYALESKLRYWWVRSLFSLATGVAAALFAGAKAPYTWPSYFHNSMEAPSQRHNLLDNFRLVSADIKKYLPAGETILASGNMGMHFVMLNDCRIVAPVSATIGIPNLSQRRKDLTLMLAPRTQWHKRRELLRKYRITYFIPTEGVFEWARPHTRQVHKIHTILLLTLNVE